MRIKKFFHIFSRILALLAAAAVVLYIAVNTFMPLWAKRYILTPEQAAARSADCALVLGAQVRAGSLSSILEDRVLTGIELYKSGATDRLLMSGDHGSENYDEVNSMKSYAVGRGVPPGDVFMDHAGFSTYESVYRAREVFEVESVLVVTQEYHLYRAIFLARMLGLDAYGVAADRRSYQRMLYNNFRESAARVKDFAMALFRPEPTYLGSPIPIWGDGSQTDDTDNYIETGGDIE